jgi:tripartite-type tricarboxylate transporter receptor subunit TctC
MTTASKRLASVACSTATGVAVAFAALLATTGGALAQAPAAQRPMTLIIPFPPGSSSDQLGRVTATNISNALGRPVIVDNKPGAGGYIGAEAAARAPGDGSVLVLTEYGTLFTSIFTKDQAVVTWRALKPVVGVGKAPFLFVSPASLPAKNVREFLALVKASPNKYNLAVTNGAGSHLQAIRFLKEQGADLVTIPYNDGVGPVTSLLAGDNHLYLGSYALSKAHIDSKRLIALGFAGGERYSLASEIPTFNEQGINFETEIFFGVLAPSTMPSDLLAQYNKSITVAMNNDNTKALLKKIGYDPAGGTPAELAARLEKQSKELLGTAAAVGIKPQ